MPTNIGNLPAEILTHIFTFLYPSWHLQYNQEHDRELTKRVYLQRTFLPGIPIWQNTPSLSPLLVNKDFHRAAKNVLQDSYTKYIHMTSRFIYSTIHAVYDACFARCTHLIMPHKAVWTFYKLKINQRMPLLRHITVYSDRIEDDDFNFYVRDWSLRIRDWDYHLRGMCFRSDVARYISVLSRRLMLEWADVLPDQSIEWVWRVICRPTIITSCYGRIDESAESNCVLVADVCDAMDEYSVKVVKNDTERERSMSNEKDPSVYDGVRFLSSCVVRVSEQPADLRKGGSSFELVYESTTYE